jgi:hypothetical protein
MSTQPANDYPLHDLLMPGCDEDGEMMAYYTKGRGGRNVRINWALVNRDYGIDAAIYTLAFNCACEDEEGYRLEKAARRWADRGSRNVRRPSLAVGMATAAATDSNMTLARKGGRTLSTRGDRYVMRGGRWGEHSLVITETDEARLAAHWAGYSTTGLG